MKTETRLQVLNKLSRKCGYCGDELNGVFQIDHVIPRVDFDYVVTNRKHWIPESLKHLKTGDVNHIDNLMPSCWACNNRKSSMHLDLFRSELQEQLSRANENSANYRMAKKYGQVVETPSLIVFYFESYPAHALQIEK